MSFLGKAGKFLRQVGVELRRVVWPTRQQTVVFTAVVFAAVIVASATIWVIDTALSGLLSLVVR